MIGNTATANATHAKKFCMSWHVVILASIVGGELLNFIMNSMLRNAKKLAVRGYQNPPHFTQDEYPFCDRFL